MDQQNEIIEMNRQKKFLLQEFAKQYNLPFSDVQNYIEELGLYPVQGPVYIPPEFNGAGRLPPGQPKAPPKGPPPAQAPKSKGPPMLPPSYPKPPPPPPAPPNTDGAVDIPVPGLYDDSDLNTSPFNGNNKVINIINQSTSVVNRVTLSSIFNSSNITSAIPISLTTFYVSGNGTNNGIYYYDGTSFTPIITGVGVRNLEIFNGDLYFSQGTATAGIYKFTGLPTSAATPTAVFTSTNFDPYGFSVSPDGCSMYVAIGINNGTHRSISKFIKNSTTGIWSYSGYRYSTE
jgi:hypothetical protein